MLCRNCIVVDKQDLNVNVEKDGMKTEEAS